MERFIKTFGRRAGKTLSLYQADLIERVLPGLSPLAQRADTESHILTIDYRLSPPYFQNRPVILEIGFGAGEHLLYLATTHPDSIIIGAEPFINGIASMMARMMENGQIKIKSLYQNIRIWPDDVRLLLSTIDYRLSTIYILHPDPWPKVRHEKRRLLQSEFLTYLSEFLAPDGKIIIGTDHTDYFNWVLEQLKNTDLKIANTLVESGYDFITPPENGLATRYCEKNKFGSVAPMYLVLTK